jgi:hypothetical protein
MRKATIICTEEKYCTEGKMKEKHLALRCAWPRHSWCQTGGIRAALAPPTNVSPAHTVARACGHVPSLSPAKP